MDYGTRLLLETSKVLSYGYTVACAIRINLTLYMLYARVSLLHGGTLSAVPVMCIKPAYKAEPLALKDSNGSLLWIHGDNG